MPFAIGDFREDAGDKLTVVSVAPGSPYETSEVADKAGPDNRVGKGQIEMMNLVTSDYTKAPLHDDAGNGNVTLTYYRLGARSQVFFAARGLPEAGANLVATLLNGLTGEYYGSQNIKMTGLNSLGWAKYDVFLYGGGAKGVPAFDTPAHRTSLIRDVNYVKYEGKTGDSFELDFGWGGWSAIQVVDASGRPGPRRSLGVRWTGPGPLLGADDKVGAEVAAGNWYNILTDYPRGKFFVLSGGCLTVAGQRVCGFVDVFDRKTGQALDSQTLPAGDGPMHATSYDCQAKILDDALLMTDSNGVYLFRSAAAKP